MWRLRASPPANRKQGEGTKGTSYKTDIDKQLAGSGCRGELVTCLVLFHRLLAGQAEQRQASERLNRPVRLERHVALYQACIRGLLLQRVD
ncbi:hypothetical protein AAFF_G00267900 [Aldrovandia affinis]|uniref:Uncharacterized protein n=1 Tax=Aldrovandia affinis TaxID=143900 RepID=A0AAD7SSB5_9TELE|nr:hypothetical protein AAFF_G00267900 [Aldrovandia affinis]